MRYSFILCCCCLLCSCNSLKKKSKLSLVHDSLQVMESREQQKIQSVLEMEQTVQENWERQQVVEIYAETPYRLHPDSGLLAGAGYLKMKISGQVKADRRRISNVNNQIKIEEIRQKEEQLKVKQVTEEKQAEKYLRPGIWFLIVFVGLIVIYLFYKKWWGRFWY